MKPPWVLFSVLNWLLPGSDRVAVLGDLEEEFHDRARHSPRQASLWIWQQALSLCLFAVLRRLTDRMLLRQLIGLIGIATGAFVTIYMWDILMARQLVGYLSTQAGKYSLLVLRSVYFAVQMTGALIIGAFIGRVFFDPEVALRGNYAKFVVPAALFFTGEALWRYLSSDGLAGPVYYMFKLTLVVAALSVGAFIFAKRQN